MSHPLPSSPVADWDFIGYRGVSLHPYPATMPYPLAEELVRKWSSPGDRLLDPFAGSGTTVRAAAANGRSAVGIDVNPLATLIARVSTRNFDLDSDIARYDAGRIAVLDAISETTSFPRAEWLARIDRWFSPASTVGLAQVAAAIRKTSQRPDVRDFLLLAFSRTVRQASLARPGELKLWKKAGNPKWESPIDIFARQAAHLLWSLVAVSAQKPLAKDSLASIVTADSENALTGIGTFQLTLTSPPYGDAWTTVAYGNFTQLSRIWLSAIDKSFATSNPVTEDARSPGGAERSRPSRRLPYLLKISDVLARSHASIVVRSEQRAGELMLFCEDMYRILKRLKAVTTTDGRVVIVMGPRRVAGVWVDTGWIFGDFLEQLGFVREHRDFRRITGKRLPTKTMQGLLGLGETINRETIDVFRKANYKRSFDDRPTGHLPAALT